MDENRIEIVDRPPREQRTRWLSYTPGPTLLIIVLAVIAAAAVFSVWYDR